MNLPTLLRPIRVRLTLWYVLLLAAVLFAFSGALYLVLRLSLYDDLDDVLRSNATLLASALQVGEQGQLSVGPGQPLLQGEQEGENFWRILDESGRVAVQARMHETDALLVDPQALAEALDRHESVQCVRVGDDTIRVYTAPLEHEGQVVGVVQLGLSLEDVNETLTALRWTLALLLPITLAMTSVGGVFMAGRALRPVDRITRRAQSISANDLSQRLNLDLADDELGRLARTLDAMIARLDTAFRRQRRFTADASHELRTPLTIIKGNLSLALARRRHAGYYRQVLCEVDQEVDQMSRLVERLLALARADADGIALHQQTISLGDLLADLVEQTRPLAEAKGLTLTAQIPPNLAAHLDPDAVTQIVLNLLDNAIKYTPSGQVRLVARRAAGETQVLVSDQGPGIPPEHLPHLFERFYRVDQARSRELGGAGLGLAIARQLARAHGGDVGVRSAPGEGSTFSLHLPQ